MGTVTRPERLERSTGLGATGRRVVPGQDGCRQVEGQVDSFLPLLAPIATAAILIPWRAGSTPPTTALFLVVVIVAVASTGQQLAAILAALVSALSFDFFLTRPFYWLQIAIVRT